jgi:Protein of unknown function (DUF2950)
MPQLKRISDPTRTSLTRWAAAPLLFASLLSTRSMAQQPGQKSYGSPEEASLALVMAAQKNDGKALLGILGPDGKNIVSSGDATEDANDRAIFVEKYHEMNRLVKEPDGTTTLYIGAKNWPTPIPLVDKGGAWFFDTQAGKKEILYRRIGENETSTIRVCQDLVTAQQAYFSLRHGEFAQAIFSDEGKRNGLYWKSAAGEHQSPLGALVAEELAKGYTTRQGGVSTPYCGYYFRILTHQGKHAQGGANSYLATGRMTKGFAILAYPAEYRSSGVMTFIVDRHGEVFEKDLGKKTAVIAKAMKEYNPGSGWVKAEDRQEEHVSEKPPQ